jgi:hypothetical protein
MEQRLRRNGIRIGTAAYPRLVLTASTTLIRDQNPFRASESYVLWSVELAFQQALPFPESGKPSGLAVATTWRNGKFGFGDLTKPATIRTVANDFISEFIGAYGVANPDAVNRPDANLLPVQSEIRPLSWGHLISGQSGQPPAVIRQVQEVISAQHPILKCRYGPTDKAAGTGFYVHEFWYKTAPAQIDKYLESAPPGKHPFRALGLKGLEKCPASPEIAFRVLWTGMRAEDRIAEER